MSTDEGKINFENVTPLVCLLFVFINIFLTCSPRDFAQAFWQSVPLLVVAVPGYLNLAPPGGVTHGSSCDCTTYDLRCEAGFWSQMTSKFALVLPALWGSIFIHYWLSCGVWTAFHSVGLAVTLSVQFFVYYFLIVLMLLLLRARS